MILVVPGPRPDGATLDRLLDLARAESRSETTGGALCLEGVQASAEALRGFCEEARLDFALLPTRRRLADFGLFVTDMDSTLITIECIDEIADMQGLKAEVAAITEAAMRGELDFCASLRRRVALLEGLPATVLDRIYTERLRLNPGAEALLAGLHKAGIKTMLVSGGFTHFTSRLQERLGFYRTHANQLEIVDGHLTGKVLGDIVDGTAKAHFLNALREELGLRPDQVIAAGDGANDMLMLQASGLGMAFHAKPKLRAVAHCCIDHGPLDRLLQVLD